MGEPADPRFPPHAVFEDIAGSITAHFRGNMKHDLHRLIFITGCNRSGITLLFRNLSEHPDLWALYVGAQPIFHACVPLDPELGEKVIGPVDPDDIAANGDDVFRQARDKEAFLDRSVPG